MQQALLAMRGSLSIRWLMLKRTRTPAKAKGVAALREAHQPPLQRQALPHQALQLQAEISASIHDSLQILMCARNRFTGSWRVASQGSLYHNSKVVSGIRIFKGTMETLSISRTSFVSLLAHIADDLSRLVVSSQSKRDRLAKLDILRPKRSS